MTSDDLLFDVTDHVATLTLNRPAQRNAMTADMRERLSRHLQQISTDPDIRVAIVTGAGGTFCAGADLKQRAASGGARAEDSSPAAVLAPDPDARWSTLKVAKPLIAAIDGYCLAGGMELALACDIRICSTAAQFGLPEIVRGFFPGGGGPQRIVRAIPQSMAMELLLTGDRIDAEAALRSGLVSRVVAVDDLMPTAQKLAARIAGHAPLAVRTVKEIATAALDQTLEQSLRFGDTMRWVIGQTEDAKEGPRAFTEKREPEFKGR
ncbi:MAG: enoyl-CoA hydratase/isomerase family protein [Alphaproteobacteria bacterium]|nr:enoyl-CoA hydratase/isomerase family protein [Alphaproteobacteria bacterium]MCB9929563.1 enoyl-CoA hydratase/isomerase family protein [Alphaproteobacteria bacterium]